MLAALKAQATKVKGVRVCGAMADLVPPHAIAEVTELLQAPYLNSFGSTETGLPPATRALIATGKIPERLSKQQSAFCQIKLVDPSDREVAAGHARRTRHARRHVVFRLLAGPRDQCA